MFGVLKVLPIAVGAGLLIATAIVYHLYFSSKSQKGKGNKQHGVFKNRICLVRPLLYTYLIWDKAEMMCLDLL